MNIFMLAYENNISLLQQQIDYANVKDPKGKTLLHYAVLGSAIDVIDYLLSQDININSLDDKGETALFDCARKAKILITKKLLNRYAKIDIANHKGETILHLAAHKGDLDMVKLLIEKGVNHHIETTESKLPIHYAILAGNLEVVKYLLDVSKVSYNKLDQYQNTFLHYAAKTTNIPMLKFFLTNGLDSNALNTYFETPLFNAVRFGTEETINLLLNHYSFIRIYNRRFETPSMIAKYENRLDFEKLLVDYEQLPVYQNYIKSYGLILAVLNRDHDNVRLLLEQGLTLKKDHLNKTALDYSIYYKFNVCEKLLRPLL